MKISTYLFCILKDFFAAFGCLLTITTIFLLIYSKTIVNTSILVELSLVAAAYTFFKFALVNNYELDKKVKMISFFICFIMADLMIILLLCFFTPGASNDISHIIAYIITILVVKGVVYLMMYSDGKAQAKLLNEKLRQYKNEQSQ